MKAALYAGNRTIRIAELPRPTPPPGHVLLRVMASGLCGSELPGFRAQAARDAPAGHEMAGVAPDGTWMCISVSSKVSRETLSSVMFDLMNDSAA